MTSRARFHLTVWTACLATCGCSGGADIDPSLPQQVIERAEAVAYRELAPSERDAISPYCCSYSKTGGWQSVDLVRFEPEAGFYVRAQIRIRPLARLTFANQCGSALYPDRCSERELEEKVDSALADRPDGLYGKYRSRWHFRTIAGDVPATVKFEGHSLLLAARNTARTVDDVLIGPLPVRPTEMIIAWDSGTPRGYPALPVPAASLR